MSIQLPGELKTCMNFGTPHEKTEDCVRWGEFESEPFTVAAEAEPALPSMAPERANREGDSQGLPIINDSEDVQSAVIRDIEARRQVGIKRYGTALQPNNGRNALLDLYEELLDAAMYVKQRLIEDELAADIPCPNCAVAEGRNVLHDGGHKGTLYDAVTDGL